jgi:hypothetical protein
LKAGGKNGRFKTEIEKEDWEKNNMKDRNTKKRCLESKTMKKRLRGKIRV